MLSARKVLITGASRGIGKAIADNLYEQGATLVLSATSEETLHQVRDEYKDNRRVHTIPCDLSNVDQRKSLVSKASEMMSGINGLVCNAGITMDKLVIRMSDEAWERVISVNLSAAFTLNREAVKAFLQNKGQDFSSIVNISSVVAFMGNPGQVNYSASKAGIVGMTKSLAVEVASKNITVNAVAPGFIQTDMTDKIPSAYREKIMESIPMKRYGTPDEVASVVSFLIGGQSRYITGTTVHVNGGLLTH
ncbi:MAG: 3-oxoacyl-(Acyl-carrier-protein) reductase [Candidatus Xenolissoclinum pacificiensis L6]|uniref:3-oxoacyl-(Acyl-carrier-protein) reductase n=1 Tax=Candidatus Xenolissoclinum pacificiensis L6 TaxID=1401685 RepID=W2V1P9_9RICK|nr:MAG: 3-oxoacyl-(Acyl-carrier-protein) reductase [Candidatus Xenolissoclinum pacificiensis L6]